ncbi:MAG: lytic murein transglycosylase, partial [Microbacterium sp.]
MSTEDRSPFDDLLAGSEGATPANPTGLALSRRGRGMIVGAIGSIAVGVLLVAGSTLVLSRSDHPTALPTASAAPQVSAALPAAVPTPRAGQASQAAAESLVKDDWIRERAAATGIPAGALAAYATASLRVATEYPACGLGWNTLAGIGEVESHHGTINGSTLGDDGVASPPIIGIPLTGETTQAIRDTDAGELDGDPVWDRAVGPMQFIPTTWSEWGSDGDDDGRLDPQNIHDSSLAAARYLCSVGGN